MSDEPTADAYTIRVGWHGFANWRWAVYKGHAVSDSASGATVTRRGAEHKAKRWIARQRRMADSVYEYPVKGSE